MLVSSDLTSLKPLTPIFKITSIKLQMRVWLNLWRHVHAGPSSVRELLRASLCLPMGLLVRCIEPSRPPGHRWLVPICVTHC